MRLPPIFLLASLLVPALGITGCTLFPASKHASLKTATGAEQTERLLWNAAAKKDFATITNLIAAGAVFTERDGSVLTREQFVERIKSSPPIDYAIGEIGVRPQGDDMVLTYPASLRESGSNVTLGTTILSVWQQTKNSGWTLVARSETPASVPPQ